MKKLICITPVIQEVHGDELIEENKRLEQGLRLSPFWAERLVDGDVKWAKKETRTEQTNTNKNTNSNKGEK